MASYNIFLQRDTDYAETLTFYSDECMSSVIDLTGYTFKAEIKASASDATVVETAVTGFSVNLAPGFGILGGQEVVIGDFGRVR